MVLVTSLFNNTQSYPEEDLYFLLEHAGPILAQLVNLSTLIACLAYCASATEIFHVNKSVIQCLASRACTYCATCSGHLQLASPSLFSSDSVTDSRRVGSHR